MKSKELWWKGNVIWIPKSESVLDRIIERYFIDFVSLWAPFWNPEGGSSFGVIGPRRPIWRRFWSVKIKPIWGLERTNALRGFFAEFKVSKWSFVALSLHIYSVFSLYKVAFVNKNDLIHLYKAWVLCALNAHNLGAGQGPPQRTAEAPGEVR